MVNIPRKMVLRCLIIFFSRFWAQITKYQLTGNALVLFSTQKMLHGLNILIVLQTEVTAITCIRRMVWCVAACQRIPQYVHLIMVLCTASKGLAMVLMATLILNSEAENLLLTKSTTKGGLCFFFYLRTTALTLCSKVCEV